MVGDTSEISERCCVVLLGYSTGFIRGSMHSVMPVEDTGGVGGEMEYPW
jgi:hypothetical protein